MNTRTEQIQLLTGIYQTLEQGRRPFAARLARELGLRPSQINRAADNLRRKGLLTERGLQLTFTGLTLAVATTAGERRKSSGRSRAA